MKPTPIEACVAGALAFLLFLVPVPSTAQRRGTANSIIAIGSLRSLDTAQKLSAEPQFNGRLGSLAELGDARLIDSVLASGKKSGYIFEMTRFPDAPERFEVRARPENPHTGQRWFFVDETGVIRFSTKGPADRNSQILGASSNALDFARRH